MSTRLLLPTVVMIRHAQSEWNREGRFSGWADPALTEVGCAEAVRAGERLARESYSFDRVYTSRLSRARETAQIVMRHLANEGVPVAADWRLNERHYGALQGLDKLAMAAEVGEDQVWRWRRGYADRPPRMADDHDDHPARNPVWADIPLAQLPNAESLADTRERVMAFWNAVIVPQLQRGQRLLIASHGNTLRTLIMALQDMCIEEVEAFEIPTGIPIAYSFSLSGEPIGWRYLEDGPDDVAAA